MAATPERLSAAEAASALHDYATLQIRQRQVYGVRYDPASGRNQLCRFDPQGGAQSLLPEPFSVRSRVHEYGGGAWCWWGDSACFVNEADQQIWRLAPHTATPQPLTATPANRYADLQPDPQRDRLLAICETHTEGAREPCNRLVVLDRAGQLRTLAEGADFYASLALSPDGRQLAWIEWDHPHQPWLFTRLCLAQFDSEGRITERRVVSDCDAAWAQPRFSPDGTLHAVVDRHNWWRIECFNGQGFEALPGEPPAQTEFTTAPWQFGLATYGWSEQGVVLALGQQAGLSRLYRHERGVWQCCDLEPGGHHSVARLHSLVIDDGQVVCVAEFTDRLPAVVQLEAAAGESKPRLTCLEGGERPDYEVSRPQLFHTVLEQGEAVPYFLYAPADQAEQRPGPVVIYTHGGPTAATSASFRPAIQYWTQRGFCIADVNYRGSTGFGRDYRLALAGRWGVSDVEDVEAVARDLISQGQADPAALFIRGNSAGGYTTLSALIHSDLFRAGASLYGVSDPARLNQITHKFESRYLHWLIGDPKREAARYAERSPLLQADRIRVPVIFFQGEQDSVVLPEQTRQMAARLAANGVAVETHYFAQEGHGFRQAINQARVLEQELAFYQRQLPVPV